MKKEEVLNNALKIIIPLQKAGVAISMGMGKTWLGLKHAEHFYTDSLRILVAAPKISIFDSWKEIAEKFGMKYLLNHIDFTTYLSLNEQDIEYDIVYLDEVHNLLPNHRKYLDQYKGRILGLTGTWPRYEYSDKGKMVKEFCPLAYEYLTDAAVSDKILNDYRIVVHPLKLGTDKSLWKAKKSGGGWMTSERDDYNSLMRWMTNSRGKEKQIASIMLMKGLMMYKTKETYAKILFDSIPEKVILFANETAQCDRMAMFTCHSKNPDSEENLELFRQGKIMKLGACQILNEGVNIPGLKQAVIMHSFSGQSPKSLQKLGRLLRISVDQMATLHFLVYQNSRDQQWLDSVLSDISPDKISYKQLTQSIK